MVSKQNNLKIFALALFCVVCAVACTGDVMQHQYKPVGREGWKKTDTLVFELQPDSSHLPLLMQVGIRITPSFPYRNLWLAMKYQLTHPDTCFMDTLCCEFSDSSGRLTGHGVTLLQYELPAPVVPLSSDRKGTVSIYHLMKKEVVPAVREVGICLRTSALR